MPSAGLGGLGARGGVRVWTSGAALAFERVDLHFLAGFSSFLLFLLVLGQQEVQEEGHDEADGVGRLQTRMIARACRPSLESRSPLSYSEQHAPLLFVHVRTCAPVSESTGNVLHVL